MLASLAAAAAALLVVSGLAKVVAPRPAARMISAGLHAQHAPLRVLLLVVRAAGIVEIGAGGLAVAAGGRLPFTLVGLEYLVLLVVSVRLFFLGRRGGHVACGCFGRDDTPVGVAHLVLNSVCLLVTGAAAISSVPARAGLPGMSDGSPARLLVGGAQIVLLTWLAYLSITALPALGAARRAVPSPPRSRQPQELS